MSSVFTQKKYFLVVYGPIMGYGVLQMGQKGNLANARSIRFPIWMTSAIDRISAERGMTFTDVVLELLRQELAVMGYNAGIGREAAPPADWIWVNKDLKIYDFSVLYGTPAQDEWYQKKAEEAGYNRMSVHEYKEEFFHKKGMEPPAIRSGQSPEKGVRDGEPA